MKVKAIRFDAPGGAEVLNYVDHELPAPGPGEIRIRHEAVGLNFIDVYQRSGLYPVPTPSGLGLEGAGTVEAVGEGVSRFAVGDRAAYGTGPLGAYAEAHNLPEGRAVKLPAEISTETAAAIMLGGLTVQYLLRQTYEVKAGDVILLHAAAGGVGLMACQWAKHLGATVIGTVGSQAKAELARAHGCDHTILYREEDVAARVREITGGAGVPVVYDSVGKDTFDASLDSLAPRGLLVSFGNASGPVPPVNLGILGPKGSLYITRPTLFTYASTTEALDAMADDLFAVVGSGAVKIEINQRFTLADTAEAHRALETRKTSGATILLP